MLKAIPDTLILFVMTVFLASLYSYLSIQGIQEEAIKTVFIASSGGLIALVTNRKNQGPSVENVEHATVRVEKSDAPKGSN